MRPPSKAPSSAAVRVRDDAPEPVADVAAPPACAALAFSAASSAGDTVAIDAACGQVPSTFNSAR